MERLVNNRPNKRSRIPSSDTLSDIDREYQYSETSSESDSETESTDISDSELEDVCHPKALGKNGSVELSDSEDDSTSLANFVDNSVTEYHMPHEMHNVAIYPRETEKKSLKKMCTVDETEVCNCLLPLWDQDFARFYLNNPLCRRRMPLNFISSGPKMIISESDPALLQFFERNPELGMQMCALDQSIKTYSKTGGLCIGLLDWSQNKLHRMCFVLLIKVDVVLEKGQYTDEFELDVTDKAFYLRDLKDVIAYVKSSLNSLTGK